MTIIDQQFTPYAWATEKSNTTSLKSFIEADRLPQKSRRFPSWKWYQHNTCWSIIISIAYRHVKTSWSKLPVTFCKSEHPWPVPPPPICNHFGKWHKKNRRYSLLSPMEFQTWLRKRLSPYKTKSKAWIYVEMKKI